jgi:hypothetical protein
MTQSKKIEMITFFSKNKSLKTRKKFAVQKMQFLAKINPTKEISEIILKQENLCLTTEWELIKCCFSKYH